MSAQGSRLQGKVAIVTGGGSGFGAAIARRFGEEGAKVVVADINTEGGEKVAAQNPANLVFQHTDVTQADAWRTVVDVAFSKFGRLDILVNNAGTSYRNKPTVDVTEDEWERVFKVNVKSIYLAGTVVIPRLIEQGSGGSVINISSTGASRPRPGLVWYNASKGAVTNATKGLAAEYGPQNIRVNSVAPLLSGTGLFSMFTGMEDTPENRAKFIGNVPLGRLTEADDIANMCLYLASDEGRFINAESSTSHPELLRQLHHAITQVGFLYISNHGVPCKTISDFKEILHILFSLDSKSKEDVALHRSPHFLGYSHVGSETTAGLEDKREQFEFATELVDTWDAEQPIYERLKGPNQWPGKDAKIRVVIERYIAELTQLSERFLQLVSEALAIPHETLFSLLSDQHRLKLVHYPPSDPKRSTEQGVGPHKDSSGWWTFLLQASPPHVKGLQALNKAGEWIDIPVIEDTFVVNIGQAFEVVTHGVCKATTHRVLSEPWERCSVPFFQGVRRDLAKDEALHTLKEYLPQITSLEAAEGASIDSAFLRGKYDTWGESQLRTKIRSHQDVGRMFYADVFDKYMNDD
ncbi:Oxoglutarate/iron-dependent dioxygenase [Penicillium malachiteum]|uniref:Oxoglutarate/iron-dependent dioxygenase n=1 Tax=Penicillium malachiteum TaxID=1324776 RepID=UPI002546B1C1|nr:Oxoglutarate/iron-dependent dioxygenase [Penicillium malachiteum]KAJ5737670.1 Oxoglutarate/iron-dependent dioxygenase [Penicillium malachiteum]